MQFNKNWRIEADAYELKIIRRTETIDKETKKVNENWNCVGHYSTFKGALKGILEKDIKLEGVKSYEALIRVHNELLDAIEMLPKPVILEVEVIKNKKDDEAAQDESEENIVDESMVDALEEIG